VLPRSDRKTEMGELIGKWLAELFERVLAEPLIALLAKAGVLWILVRDWVDQFGSRDASDAVAALARRLASNWIENSPEARATFDEAYGILGAALRTDHAAAMFLLLVSMALLTCSWAVPLLAALVVRPRARVFVSFNRQREPFAEKMQRALESAGIDTVRLPFDPSPVHDDLLERAVIGLRRSHLFVCVPGPSPSFVEHEVLAATTANKPVAFVVSQAFGALPNTALKRFPVFRLESLSSLHFAPLAQFMHHIAGDVRSTWSLCNSAFRHPAVMLPARIIRAGVLWSMLGLLVYCVFRVYSHRPDLLRAHPGFESEVGAVLAIRLGMLLLLATTAAVAFIYCGLVIRRLHRQFSARRRMRLSSVRATFRREDWVGTLPGLRPGMPLYDVLFASAPIAHHERRSAPES
jgi:hypothetical protein